MTTPASRDIEEGRFAAFISYAHADAHWARRLHRQLESYRLPTPARFGGRTRIGRIFLDRSELATAASLSGVIETALDASESLVVVCSPRAAASRWVNEEVRRFRAQGKGDRIFCLIVDGDPAGTAAPSPFPPALLETADGAAPPEPLAADLRPGADGPRAALLKLIAGIVGVPFDALQQREQLRRQRRLAAVATVSSVLLLVMTALTIAALLARREAERQRDTAIRTSTFMRDMFGAARPERAAGREVTVREMLDLAAAQTLQSGELRAEPETRADLLALLAQVYSKLGRYDRSDALARAAALPDAADPDRVLSLAAVEAENALTRADYPRARALADRALALPASGEPTGSEARLRLLMTSGYVASAQSDSALAQAAFGRARRDALAAVPRDRNSATAALAGAAFDDVQHERLDRAERRLRIVVAERRAAGEPDHPDVLAAANMLGVLASKRGDAAAAERAFRAVIAVQGRVLGPRHLDTAVSRGNLARTLVDQRRFAAARDTALAARRDVAAAAGGEHDTLANIDDTLGLAQGGLGDVSAARAAFARGLAIARHHGMPKEAELLADAAELDCRAGAVAAGRQALAAARAATQRLALAEPWRRARLDQVAAGCLLAAGDRAAARALVAASAAPIAARWGTDSLFGATARRQQAAVAGARTAPARQNGRSPRQLPASR